MVNMGLFFLFVVFPIWFVMMGTYLHFCWRGAPSAVRRWADAEGYHVVERKLAGIFDSFSFGGGSGHHVYRIVVRDYEGQEYRGLLRIGISWFCPSVSRCPVEVRWAKAKADTRKRFKKLTDYPDPSDAFD
jgi:hypothetical protein